MVFYKMSFNAVHMLKRLFSLWALNRVDKISQSTDSKALNIVKHYQTRYIYYQY